MQKVLITGGAGFIGSHIAEKLLDDNFKVAVIDNLSSGSIDNLPKNENLSFYKQDIKDSSIEEIFEKVRPDYVVHLAAQTSVNYSIANPCEDASINILASINLLEICKKYNIKKIIVSSSAAVYGVPQYLPIDEKHPTEPISPYGLSKLTVENYVKLSAIPYIIFRFSNVYGPRQKSSKESGVIAIFNDAMPNNKDVGIFGDGNQIRDFVYVEDIADIIKQIIFQDIQNEIFNFSTNSGVSLNKLFSEMAYLYNYKKPANYLPERLGDIKDSILSNEKINKIIKNFKYTCLKDGLEKLKNCP